MSAYTKAMATSRTLVTSAHNNALRLKAAGMLESQLAPMANINPWADNRKSMTQYGLNRGWLYSAVNAIAMEGAGQIVHLGRMSGGEEAPEKRVRRTKCFLTERMTNSAREKAARRELEIIEEHPLYKSLEQPNLVQGRWQFVYSFIANLCLTGWSYIVAGEHEGRMEYWSLPTTWIKPDHTDGPFTKFKIVDPKKPESAQDDVTFDRSQVAFAYLPNPSDPMSALAPTTSQMPAIRIDDHIMTSQEVFFQNGIFPSSVVVIGKDPHPDVPGGVRPRLTAAQRRQVYGVVRKAMGGVANYGSPAIIDGLIEKIERFSMSQNEMGWDKSEDKIRARILSAYGVHPFILGEVINVGGYSQSTVIEKRFFKRVNAYLDMLGNAMSNFTSNMEGEELLVWWEKCEAVDPQIQWANLRAARKDGTISQNEMRAKMGFPPDEDHNESLINPNLSQHLLKLLEMLAGGTTTPLQAQATMEGWGLPTPLAKKLSKPPKKEVVPTQLPGAPGGQPALPPPGADEDEDEEGKKPFGKASKELQLAIGVLRMSPEEIAGYVVDESKA